MAKGHTLRTMDLVAQFSITSKSQAGFKIPSVNGYLILSMRICKILAAIYLAPFGLEYRMPRRPAGLFDQPHAVRGLVLCTTSGSAVQLFTASIIQISPRPSRMEAQVIPTLDCRFALYVLRQDPFQIGTHEPWPITASSRHLSLSFQSIGT